MSEQEHQPSVPAKRRRAARAKAEEGNLPEHRVAEVQPASLPEPYSGKRWGEIPFQERQAELAQRLQAWDQERDHGDRPGPFAKLELTGADVYWLAAPVSGNGDSAAGRKRLDQAYPPNYYDNFVFLYDLHLEGADLSEAQLQGAYLGSPQVEGAVLAGAQLHGARLTGARLEGAFLQHVQLQGADLEGAQIQRADLSRSQLQRANLKKAVLEGSTLSQAHLVDANLTDVRLQEAHLDGAQLQGANFANAHLEGADLRRAQLSGAHLFGAQLSGADLSGAELSGARLTEAFLDVKTKLAGVHFDSTLKVADVFWNDVPLIIVDWGQATRLGDEPRARRDHDADGRRKQASERVGTYLTAAESYQTAERAYRQLAVVLRGQGITEAADRFTYRALIMHRKALWWQLRERRFNKLGAYLFSGFLAALTGYGFRMWRIIAAYALVVLAFAAAYWSLGFYAPPGLNFWQAMIVSVTAFHGRVFSNPFTLTEPQIVITALEAIFGLVIEGVFIAMLTQRFFSR